MEDDFKVFAESEVPVLKKEFRGYTNADGTRCHDAPSHWPFGTIGPIAAMGFRYVPDELVHEKEVPIPKIKPTEAAKAFDYLARCLTTPIPQSNPRK